MTSASPHKLHDLTFSIFFGGLSPFGLEFLHDGFGLGLERPDELYTDGTTRSVHYVHSD